ncbi:hypothetical protein CAC42_4089 [Sphaceloma murrayae]|uniref:Fe2OG dioxygenase domain-containing protein n=1 Tax=Sphaceloma murrayae TaxID=2082308 RepID=A0A2K1QKI1_9PEZI|nr:hypothetical protein CAC42_4089 [Sphaceloma murrayae]
MTSTVTVDTSDLAPVSFPQDVPTIDLPKVSLSKLASRDAAETARVTTIMRTSSFFMLDLMDHPSGVLLYESIVECARLAGKLFTSIPFEKKQTFQRRKNVAILDKGALGTCDENGLYRKLFSQGYEIARLVLEAFQTALQVEDDAILQSHDLNSPSGHTIRMLRYPAATAHKTQGRPTLAAHRDWTSLTILFTWLGGLQVPKSTAKWYEGSPQSEDDWAYVRPVPGCACINAGEALQLLTGKMVKAGLHRVVAAPGDQEKCDKLSVFIGIRPKNEWPMRPYRSPLIPDSVAEDEDYANLTCEEWGGISIAKWIAAAQARERAKLAEGQANRKTGSA